MLNEERIWIADSEAFKYDTFWVFLNATTGETIHIHNDNLALNVFLQEYDPILCGFNFRDYDQHILRACLLNWSPEEIKELSDIIINNRDNPLAPYEHFNGERWVDIPPIIDLVHDIVNKPSLKQIEGFMCASIMESSIPFDIDRPLTKEEIAEVFSYCEHDVMRTFDLFWLREEYVNSKIRMCEICGVDPEQELKHPMARVAADLLNATFTKYHNEDYIIPESVNQDNIPSAAYWFAKMLDRDEGLHTVKNSGGTAHQIIFYFHGIPVVMGVGGLHAATGKIMTNRRRDSFSTYVENIPYHERADDDRIILIQDIGAYYPNTIVKHDYMSRSVPKTHSDIYPGFIVVKDEAKADKDKATEIAAKLFINSITGTFRSETNKLSDPMQGISLCVTGQLQILDLIEQLHKTEKNINLIQVNTDGWIISINRRDLPIIEKVVSDWEKETGYTVDTKHISAIWQRDVNNYILEFSDGSLKVKGGTVGGYYGKEKGWAARGFAYNNTIVDKAIVDYLVYGIPTETTVANETDLSRFQIITKANRRSYVRCWGDCHDQWREPEGKERTRKKLETKVGFETYLVNRLYATKDTTKGKLMKETHAGALNDFPDTPEHCVIDNGAELSTDFLLTELDREWYNALIKKKLEAFVGKDYKHDGYRGKDRGKEGDNTEESRATCRGYSADIRTKAVDVPAVSRRSVECDGTRRLCGAYQLRIC